jgi:hypothetical protein
MVRVIAHLWGVLIHRLRFRPAEAPAAFATFTEWSDELDSAYDAL